jgi:hypothetical protein
MAAASAAAAAYPTWATALFRPTNRCRDLIRGQRRHDSYELPHRLTEVELLPDLSPEHVLATGITWEDFCRFAGHEVLVWMGPSVYVYIGDSSYPIIYPWVVFLGSSNHRCPSLCVYAASGPETAAATTATCDFAVRLFATSKENDTSIHGRYGSSFVPISISGPALSHFFQESQDNLRKFTLEDVLLNEEQIRALATTESQPEMEIILKECKLLRDPGCHGAFVEYLHRDGGPIQLNRCEIDWHVLAAALEGNSRVTRLGLSSYMHTTDATKGVFLRSLAENKSLVKLDLQDHTITTENWTAMCHSLKAHSTLTILDLRNTIPRVHTGARFQNDEQKAQRTRMLAALVQENRVLHTISLYEDERDEHIYVESILPILETNLYRPRVLGIKKVDIALRRAFLGLALQTKSVRSKSNLIWMFLSGNQDVVLRSDEESAAVLQSDEESAAVLQLDEESSEQEEEVATRKRKL